MRLKVEEVPSLFRVPMPENGWPRRAHGSSIIAVIVLPILGILAGSALVFSALVAFSIVDGTPTQLEAAGAIAVAAASLMLVLVTWTLARATEGLAASTARLELMQREEASKRKPRLRAKVRRSDTGFVDFVVRNQGGDSTSLLHASIEIDGSTISIPDFERSDGPTKGNHQIEGHGKAEFRGRLTEGDRIPTGTQCVLRVVPLEGDAGAVNFVWGPRGR